MFSQKEYAVSAPCKEILKVKYQKSYYKIIPLDDYALWKIENGSVSDSLCFYIMGCSVLDNSSEKPIGEKIARERYGRFRETVEYIVQTVLKVTKERRQAEFNIYEDEKSSFLRDRFSFLKYSYCRRFKCDPCKTKLSRATLIREWAFRDLQLQGAFVEDRNDYIGSVKTWLLLLIAVSLGYNRNDLENNILDGHNKIKKRKYYSENKNYEEINKNTDLFFRVMKIIYGKDNKEQKI